MKITKSCDYYVKNQKNICNLKKLCYNVRVWNAFQFSGVYLDEVI